MEPKQRISSTISSNCWSEFKERRRSYLKLLQNPRRRRVQHKPIVALGLLLALTGLVLVACGAPEGPSIQVEDIWARPALAMMASGEARGTDMGEGEEASQPMAGTGAVFMRLVNKGGEADRLVGGTTDVARAVEIHETVVADDVMKMQMLADGLEIPAHGEVLLKPGSYHIMLIGIQRDLNVGNTFTLDLEFEKSGSITVQPEVREP
jgi:copper(I)-binding protein